MPCVNTPVDFVCTHLKEAVDPCLPRLFQQHACADHVRSGKTPRIEDRPVHMRLSRTIYDSLYAMVAKDASYCRGIANVGMDKGVPRVPGQIGDIVQIAGIP
jgi:hypothetical protein